MKLIKLFIVLSFFWSCCPKIVSKETVIHQDTIVSFKVRDSLISIPPIYITLKDNVNCDSLNRAQFAKRTIRKDGLTHSVEIKDGVLVSHCNADSLKLLLKLRDKQINILKNVTTKEKIEVFKMHWWEEMFMWFGITYLLRTILIFLIKNKIVP